MNPDNTPWRPVQPAAISWREHDTPYSDTFADVYYSADDGLAECRHVFLAGNGLPERWQHHAESTFRIAETGFGTGLNFLATYAAWQASPSPRPRLHYIAVEKHPLTRQDLQRALQRWPQLADVAAELEKAYPLLVPGLHRVHLASGAICLDLWWQDAEHAFTDMAALSAGTIDAWYLDGFAPARNETLWTPALFNCLAALSREGATFSTFTAAGQVRRDLENAGFTVNKRAGYGRKRESLAGVLAPSTQVDATSELYRTWDIPARRATPTSEALVIGAGLAGAHAAAALASRGVAVTVIERDGIASGASANAQGVLYTRLSRQHSDVADFALASFLHATALYRGLFDQGQLQTPGDGALCGAFLQSKKSRELDELADILRQVPELASVLAPDQAAIHLGVRPACSGLWLPRSGWLSPPQVCAALLVHPLITVMEHAGNVELERDGDVWCAVSTVQAENSVRRAIAAAPAAVLATGLGVLQSNDLAWLPLQAVRGQTTLLPSTETSRQLRAVLCHHGYIAPTSGEHHCIGATFDPGDSDQTLRPGDHAKNLESLADAVESWRPWLDVMTPELLAGTVRLRCASRDYLPVVGQVPAYDAFCEQFSGLRRNAKQTIAARGEYLDGLFVSTAHGSRGLTSAPIAGELLASAICREPAPLPRKLCRALSPARFIIRDLIRNQN